MQAYAVQGDVEEIKSMLKLVAADKYLRLQVCNSMKSLMTSETLDGDVTALIEKNICK